MEPAGRKEYADWLQGYPWTHFLTLTFSRPTSPAGAMRAWERTEREALPDGSFWFVGAEPGEKFGRWHLHALIHVVRPLEAEILGQWWRNHYGISHVRTIRKGATFYVSKYAFKEHGDWRIGGAIFGANLPEYLRSRKRSSGSGFNSGKPISIADGSNFGSKSNDIGTGKRSAIEGGSVGHRPVQSSRCGRPWTLRETACLRACPYGHHNEPKECERCPSRPSLQVGAEYEGISGIEGATETQSYDGFTGPDGTYHFGLSKPGKTAYYAAGLGPGTKGRISGSSGLTAEQ